MIKLLPIIGFIVTVVLAIYLDSPYSFINKENVQVTSIPNEVLLAEGTDEESEAVSSDSETADNESVTTEEEEDQEANAEESEEALDDYTLEMILEKTTVEGDYVIEEYREYEVYKDENGEIIKSVPTSHFDYLRYYDEK